MPYSEDYLIGLDMGTRSVGGDEYGIPYPQAEGKGALGDPVV